MKSSWAYEPNDRPTFNTIIERLSKINMIFWSLRVYNILNNLSQKISFNAFEKSKLSLGSFYFIVVCHLLNNQWFSHIYFIGLCILLKAAFFYHLKIGLNFLFFLFRTIVLIVQNIFPVRYSHLSLVKTFFQLGSLYYSFLCLLGSWWWVSLDGTGKFLDCF